MSTDTHGVDIRWTRDDERDARVDVLRSAWLGAYSEIFGEARIESLFRGDIDMQGDWTQRRTANLGTLVAVVDGAVVGLISLGMLEDGVGEVAALYVKPEWQGSGVGGSLWDGGLAVFAHRGIARFELWTLKVAKARGFYEHHRCTHDGDAVVSIGDIEVPAVRYVRDVIAPE